MLKSSEQFIIRLAVPDDALKCAEINVKSWLFAYSHCIPAEILKRQNARRAEMWTKLLANNLNHHYVMIRSGEMIGTITITPARDGDLPDTVYELTGLYLDPDFIGQGCGKIAMSWIKKEIAARGYHKISLWVLEQNHRAKAFYEKSGFKPDGKSKESGLGDAREERYICEIKPLQADEGVSGE